MKLLARISMLAVVCAGVAYGEPSFVRLGEPPSELLSALSAQWGNQESRGTVQFPRVQFENLAHRKLKATLPEARHLLVPEMPEVPFLLRRIPLRRGTTATAILDNIQLEETTAAVPLKAIEKTLVWEGSRHALSFPRRDGSRYFPGKFVSAAARDGVLNLAIFPVQYDRKTGKVLTLRSADLLLNVVELPSEYRVPKLWSSPSLIVTSEAMLPAAKQLQDFHARALGIQSDVVTVETIAKEESPVSEDELPSGYKTRGIADDVVSAYDANAKTGYNYELARRIIHYLQARMGTGTPVRYVTLLGDATIVPPSYYFSYGGELGVTDACYGALKQCMDPKLAVGRLPFRTVAEVENFIAKTKRWLRYAASSPSELSLYGGKAFPTDVYIAELGTLATINSPKDNWRGVQKFFRTKKTYTKKAVLDLVAGKGTSSLIYYLDHGGGNTWGVESESVTSNEILAAQDSGPTVNPVVASVACTDAAFDKELVKSEIFSGSEYGEVSIGVAMLRSRAGAVAYLGSARPALGQPVYNVDANGNLSITGTTYGLQLLDNFLSKYETARGGRLGDSVLASMQAYVYENGNDMSQDDNRYTLLNQELLGDPVLPLPVRSQVAENFGFPHSNTKFDVAGGAGSFPAFRLEPHHVMDVSFEATAPLAAFLLKMVNDGFESGEKVIEQQGFEGSGQMVVTAPSESPEGNYFLRLENRRGVPMERQVWFQLESQSFEELALH